MWTSENRGSYDRSRLRYPSDVTDDEAAHIGPLIPPAKRGRRRRSVDVRENMNGLSYILSTGGQWAAVTAAFQSCRRPGAIRRVRPNGSIKWGGDFVFISETLKGEPLGIIDRATKKRRRFTTARPQSGEPKQNKNTVTSVTGL